MKQRKDLEEIKKVLKKGKPILREKFMVKEIGIFGSFVRGGGRKKSDVDILLSFISL